jgi:hypothetical protein
VERSAEEDFLEGFGGREPSRATAPAANAASSALQHRFTAVANADGDHSTSFDAWMRGRDVDAMVVTTETLLQDKTNIAEASYVKLTLPKKVTPDVVRQTHSPSARPRRETFRPQTRCAGADDGRRQGRARRR